MPDTMQSGQDSVRPQPLTPADCDLRDFQFMPLDVLRLRDSDIAVMVSGEEFRSAVMLWCAAWHQVPAGSLPTDDRSLANLAGYGRAVNEWMKVKEGALRGWLECSDGRFYHAVVCEKANESWDSKLQHAYDKLVDRLRKLNKKREETGLPSIVCPAFDVWKILGRPMESDLLSIGNGADFQRKQVPIPPEGVPSDLGHMAGDGNFTRGAGADDADEGAHLDCSGGTEDFSDGIDEPFRRKDSEIPPEKGLKGQVREGTYKEEDKTASTPKPREIPNPPLQPADWLAHFRDKHGVILDPSSVHDRKKAWPIFSSWCNVGLTLERVDAAVITAQAQATESIAFLPAYVDRVIASQSAPKVLSTSDVRAQEREEVFATLGGRKASHECTSETIDVAARFIE